MGTANNSDPYGTGPGVPAWLNTGDNAWQMTAATLVGIQSVPGLVILHACYVKKKWAVNSTFMALYAFAVALPCWMLFDYKFAFGEKLLPIWGKGGPAITHGYLLEQSSLPSTKHDGLDAQFMFYPMVTTVFYQFVFAALTLILVSGSLLGRMNIIAWMLFAPLWLTFSYTVGAFSIWGGGFLYQSRVLDYCGGYVIHLASGTAGFVAAYWVGPRTKRDRARFPPNNLLLMVGGAGLLWLGWSGFNGGGSYSANTTASLAVINTHICAATSLLVWLYLDRREYKFFSVIGVTQGMITGLVCITPGAGFVEPWAAIIMGILSGSIPWFTLNMIHRKWTLLNQVDDTMAVFHTHAVAGIIGGISVGFFTQPDLANNFSSFQGLHGFVYSWHHNGGVVQGLRQIGWQIVGALFIITWNVVVTSLICQVILLLKIPLRMSEEFLEVGDDAVHGEEAYALWGDGGQEPSMKNDRPWNHDTGRYEKHPSGAVTPVANGIAAGPTSFEVSEQANSFALKTKEDRSLATPPP